MIKALIFDLDGLISDTEKLHMQAYCKAFKDKGIEISPSQYQDHWIKKGLGVEEMIQLKGRGKLTVKEMRKLKDSYYDELMNTSLVAMPYAIEFIKCFSGKIPMAVASASMKSNVERVLKEFGIISLFEFYLSADDVKKRKPDPEVWIKAAERFHLQERYCLAIEDAEKGVVAAYQAQMPVLAVPNEFTKDHDFSKATYKKASLFEALPLVESLIKD